MDIISKLGPLVSEIHYKIVTGYIKHRIDVNKVTLPYGSAKMPKALHSIDEPTVFADCDGELPSKIIRSRYRRSDSRV